MDRSVSVPCEPLPRVRVALALCLLPAMSIVLGSFHDLQGSDSIIPILISLQHWTFWYWGSNRAGSLYPALALPVQDPFWNLMLQGVMGIWTGLAVFFLVSRYVNRDHTWRVIGALSAAAILVLLPRKPLYFVLAGYQAYSTACSLVIAGHLVLESGPGPARVAVAACAALVACWVSSIAGLMMTPLILLRGLLVEDIDTTGGWRAVGRSLLRSRTALMMALLAGATLAIVVVMMLSPIQETDKGVLHVREWPAAWRTLGGHAARGFGNLAWLSAPAAAGLFAHRNWRPVLVLLLAAVAQIPAVGWAKWVQLNSGEFGWRYTLLLAIVGTVGLVTALCGLVRPALARAPRAVEACAWFLLMLGAVYQYGPPSLSGVRAQLDAGLGQHTPHLLEARVTHVCGGYWSVWASVFHANMVLHERGESRRLWGMAYRHQSTHERWSAVPVSERRVGVLLPDPHPADTANQRNLLLPRGSVLVESHPDLQVFVDASVAPQR